MAANTPKHTGSNAVPVGVDYPGTVTTTVMVEEQNNAQREVFRQQQEAQAAGTAVRVFRLEAKAALERKVAQADKAYAVAREERNKGGEALGKAVRAFAWRVDIEDTATKKMVVAINAFYPRAEMTAQRLFPHEPALINVHGGVTCDVAEWLVVGRKPEYAARVSVSTSVSIPAVGETETTQDGWQREVVLGAKLTKAVQEQLKLIEIAKQCETAARTAKGELGQLDTHADLLEAQALRQQLEAKGEHGAKLLASVDAARAAVSNGNWLVLEGPAPTQAALPAPRKTAKK
jgi:hypothetical protein